MTARKPCPHCWRDACTWHHTGECALTPGEQVMMRARMHRRHLNRAEEALSELQELDPTGQPPTATGSLRGGGEGIPSPDLARPTWMRAAAALSEAGVDCTILDPNAVQRSIFHDGDPLLGAVQVLPGSGRGWVLIVNEPA